MKKLLSALAAIAVCTALTACGNDTAETTAATETTTAVAVPESKETVTEETTETSADTTAAETTVTEEAETTAAETTVSEETSAAEETTTATIAETSAAETTAAETEADSEEEIVADDNAEEMSVNNKFANMDEFLTGDIFMIDGKTVSADKTLSASIFDTLNGDFYFESSDFDGSAPFKFAVKGDMIMTESETDGRSNKMIIRDSKAYTFDHENKIALFIPAEKELASQYTPENMNIIPKNISKESFVISDVTIEGKTYKFEYGTTSDWAMLYTSDGKLYASVQSGDSLDFELYKFSVTNKLPSGTFDIPEDYFQLDLEEMMQNAPPPEEME